MELLKRYLFAVIFLLIGATGYAKDKTYNIGITQIVEHYALDEVRKGAVDYLKGKGYKLNINYLNASGNMMTATQIAKTLIGKKPDVIIAVATPVAQSVVVGNTTIPVVFAAITDPVGAKLVKSMNKPAGIATGTSDRIPIKKSLELVRKFLPKAKKIAILYNSAEDNSISSVKEFKENAKLLGFTPVEGVVSKSSEVIAVAKSLVGKTDAFFVSTDNTVASAIEGVIKVSYDTKIPVFASDKNSVKKGAIAAYSIDNYRLGQQTGEIVEKILQGQKPSDIPVQTQDKVLVKLNIESAKKIGLKIPDSILKASKSAH